jgi:nucleotide-binding universal stress UspA family protein
MTSDLYRNIVIATDGSENTQTAIAYGIELAKLSRATVYALHVIDTAHIISEGWTVGKKTIREMMKAEGEKMLSEIKRIGKDSGIEVKEVLLHGHPSEEIINFAENNNIDLIVMGTLGKTGLDRFLIGSIAGKVARNSKVPVMVVRTEIFEGSE